MSHSQSNMKDWIFMPHAGHLIVGKDCVYHLNTFVNGYIVSTVGEWWPDRIPREIHAKVYDPTWFLANKHLGVQNFDFEYMKKFGFMEIGANRTYETLVFTAKKDRSKCCPYVAADWSELDMSAYNDPDSATIGHYKTCHTWAKK